MGIRAHAALLARFTLVSFIFFAAPAQADYAGWLEHLSAVLAKRVALSEAERDWVSKRPTIRFRTAENPPYHFDQKNPRGLSVDYARLICRTYGLNCVFQPNLGGEFGEAIGRIGRPDGPDVLLTVKPTDDRKKYGLFTDEYLISPVVVTLREDGPATIEPRDLRGKQLVVAKGYLSNELILREIPGANIIEIPTQSLALMAFSGGMGDAYLGDLAGSTFLMDQLQLSNLRIAAPINYPTQGEVMVIRPDWVPLVALANKVFSAMTNEEKRTMRSHWYSVDYTAERWKRYAVWASVAIAALFLATMAVLVWNRTLNRAIVARKSAEARLIEESERIAELNRSLEKIIFEKNELLKTLSVSAKANTLGTMVSSLAHELNQPLAAMRLNSQYLLKKLDSGITLQKQREVLEDLIRDNIRAADIIQKLRSLYERGADNFEPVDVGHLIEDVHQVVASELKAHGIACTLDLQPGVRVMGDASQLQMVLLNLFNNAIDAVKSHPGPRQIVVNLSRNAAQMLLKFTDNGVGVAGDQSSRVFELFYTTKPTGTGVGLWLTKAIVEHHGGEIQAKPNPQGGAVFEVALEVVA